MISNLELLDRFFEGHNSFFEWNRPESGTMTFPKFLLTISIDQFTKQLVEKAVIFIMPGSIYDFSGNFFRIGFGRKTMPEVLVRFEQHNHQGT
ncbi:MAG: hypothetical protein KR126chlam4_01451 [Candidatus Anoxychlamydiales bacterium]|nr:hypothetical protein [Candidatus Anoxychlamydiales bacterium]HEU63846.1 hypothetical protein [Chlamydiota bacterium]